jgi:hypothetical protein
MYVMAAQSLNTNSSGDQFSTGTPQSGSSPITSSTSSGSQLQTNISTNPLQSNVGSGANGISLNSVLPVASTTTPASAPQSSKHHVSGPLLGIAAFLLIAAVILAWLASKSTYGENNN